MGIFNKRNAVLGWLTWSVGKRVVARKAKAVIPRNVVPSAEGGSGKGKAVKAVAVVAGAVGALAFWKAKHRDSTDYDSLASQDPRDPS